MHILIKGIIIGLLTGIPVGPIGALCLKATLTNGVLFGLAVGLSSCIADSTFAGAAVLGLTFIFKFFVRYQNVIRILGGIILLIFGTHIILSKKENKQEISNSKTLAKSFLSTFIIAIANPATIFSFLFVFATYGSQNIGHGVTSKIILIIGVFCGSFLWWVILVLAAQCFHNHLNRKSISIINKTIGSIIICFGLFFIITANYKRQLSFMHLKPVQTILHIKSKRLFYKK